MDALSAAAVLITLAALFSWLNHRYIRQPASIALLLFSLALSLALIALGKLGLDPRGLVPRALDAVDLDRVLLDSMLSFLLFAGALHVDLGELARRKWGIGFLASLGVVVSALLAGAALWWIFRTVGHPVPLIYCLLFGALISPTDPIAVLALALHLSGPIAIVVAGVLIGNHGRRYAMSARTRERLDTFWELLDEILNAVLFVMIGLELLRLDFDATYAWAGALAIPAVLA